MSEADRTYVFKHCRFESVKKGTELIKRGETYDKIYVVAKGMFRLDMPVHREDGPVATVGILKTNDFLGEPFVKGKGGYVSQFNVTAVLDSDVFSCPCSVMYEAIMRCPDCLAQLFFHCREALQRARRQLARVQGASVEERVGGALYEMSRKGRLSASRLVDKRVSQKLLAAISGMSREQVNKTIRALGDEGLLKRTEEGYEIDENLAPADLSFPWSWLGVKT